MKGGVKVHEKSRKNDCKKENRLLRSDYMATTDDHRF